MYSEFEEKFNRISKATDLKNLILANKAILNQIPEISKIKESIKEWLPSGLYTCLDPRSEDCTRSEDCLKRCSWKYWQEHSFEVAHLMKSLAKVLNEDEEKWELAGLVHDFDYLHHPHHIDTVESAHAHPVEICRWLFEKRVSYDVCLAVLEHAPHLRLTPSSKLSYGLIACDEFSTMIGSNYSPRFSEPIDPAIARVFNSKVPRSKFVGFKRNDMESRFQNALNNIS